jgi:hypothetical protein
MDSTFELRVFRALLMFMSFFKGMLYLMIVPLFEELEVLGGTIGF